MDMTICAAEVQNILDDDRGASNRAFRLECPFDSRLGDVGVRSWRRKSGQNPQPGDSGKSHDVNSQWNPGQAVCRLRCETWRFLTE
jgi:hypothetical protein